MVEVLRINEGIETLYLVFSSIHQIERINAHLVIFFLGYSLLILRWVDVASYVTDSTGSSTLRLIQLVNFFECGLLGLDILSDSKVGKLFDQLFLGLAAT